MDGKFVAYFRVSRKSQGESGLGLEAQERAVSQYLNGGSWELLDGFVEVESGKRDDNRPELHNALIKCKLTKATLLIAKLDRLSRNSAFLNNLLEAGVDIRCCDMPEADPFMLRIMAAVAQKEREAISQRTKEGLASIKAKLAKGQEHVSKAGNVVTTLGGYRGVNPPAPAASAARKAAAMVLANDLKPMVTKLRNDGLTLAQIADSLNLHKVKTPRGAPWNAMTVKRVLDRLTQDAPQSA